MCPTSSSEAAGLFLRRAPFDGAAQVECAFTGTGIDVAERPQQPGAVHAAVSRLEGELAVPVMRMHQVHGAQVHRVVRDAAGDLPVDVPEVDALVTTEPGVALMARSADCVPVLLADTAGAVVGAVHAGRVGLAAGVVRATVARMRELGAVEVTAVVGPAICGRCYEVPAEMRDDVAAAVPGTGATTRWGTPALDLPAGAVAQLRAAGVLVRTTDVCTYTDETTWSHRRQGSAAGRMGALVWRKP